MLKFAISEKLLTLLPDVPLPVSYCSDSDVLKKFGNRITRNVSYVLTRNQIIRISIDKKLHRKHKIVIKLFELEISITVCTINKLRGNYNYFIHIKM